MNHPNPTIAQQLAQMARTYQERRTGRAPKSVSVVVSEDTLVVTLHGALSPAEQALAKNSRGAADLQEFHRKLFGDSVDSLRKEIKRITGRDVRESAAEIDSTTGSIVHAFTTGTVVQVFLLADDESPEVSAPDRELAPV